MPRSSQYVQLFKKLLDATQLADREEFDKQIEEIREQMDGLPDEERFDLEINIKTETKTFYEKFD